MITIKRWYLPDCTLGRLSLPNGFQCFTLELPDRSNEPGISCIPRGVYNAFKRKSPKNGLVYELRNVPGRSFIQGHAGNFTSQIEGCILHGDSIRFLNSDGVPDVANSRKTLDILLAMLPDEFEVTLC
jgi:hypothetical protein